MNARRVIGYLRVSTRERRSTRPSRTTQRHEIEVECARRGWPVVRFEEDVRSGRSLRRPGLHAALDACRRGEADALMVARLDRLTDSVEDLAYLMHRAVADRFTIVAPDLDVDLDTDRGAHLAHVLSAAAGWHPRGVGRRTVQALEQHREGDRRGRPSSTPEALADRIRQMRSSGATLQAICDTLNSEGVPTPRGGTHWRPTSLRAIVRPQAGSSPPRTKGLVRR
jgi:DNA invertase Pin-like site-specific DNA recombinase